MEKIRGTVTGKYCEVSGGDTHTITIDSSTPEGKAFLDEMRRTYEVFKPMYELLKIRPPRWRLISYWQWERKYFNARANAIMYRLGI